MPPPVTENLEEPLLSPQNDGTTSTVVSAGEIQPDKCRDWPFAFLFYAHILIIIIVACALGIPALARKADDDNSGEDDYSDDLQGIFKLTLICACIGMLVSFLSLNVALACSRIVIQLSLAWSLVASFTIMIWAFTKDRALVGCICLIYFLFNGMYVCCIAKRIPFAAANLSTGLRAVKSNFGVVLLTYFMVFLSWVYTLYWIMALIGAYDDTADCGEEECRSGPDIGLLFLMLLFLFWTQQFIQNSIHVTVAGVVAKWWRNPSEANSCCSKATKDSFMKALVYSAGSIAFGSLFCAIVQAIHSLINKCRQQDEGNSCLFCILNCLLSCMDSLIQYFNRWAWMYVGIYGYSYCKAAKSVIALFRERGWTTVINDDLIGSATTFLILITALVCGVVGQILTENDKWFPEKDDVEYLGLGLGFIVGLFISSITYSVVGSSADAVFVLWAEDPAKLRTNHPDLFDRMMNAWTKMYPDETPVFE